jgi:hypothetical protein
MCPGAYDGSGIRKLLTQLGPQAALARAGVDFKVPNLQIEARARKCLTNSDQNEGQVI